MNKICTSLEQSKKLIELGIDMNTADMWYHGHSSPLKSEREYDSNACPFHSMRPNWDIPALSLASLLSVIPKHIKNYNVLRIDIDENAFAIWYDEIGYGVNNDLPIITMESAVDVCYEMIVRLKENKKI
jgi:hypothetical protein